MSSTVVPDSFELRGLRFSGLDALPRDEAERLYGGVVRYGAACGCGAGAIGAALAGCLYLLGLSLAPAAAAAVLGGLTGKFLGLWWARRRFDVGRRRLETALHARAERETHHG
jgi:hypothetical protein